MNYILYNPLSNNGMGEATANEWKEKIGEATMIDVTKVSADEYLATIGEEDAAYLIGGDGTLNKFCNLVKDKQLKGKYYYCKAGTGNDFFHDVEEYAEDGKVLLNDLVKDLPTVIVNGKESVFINGIGFGIDGYCCEEGDKMRAAQPGVKIDYAGIAIKGLLFKYKPLKATVIVDGKESTYKKVWLAPTMKGRYYGGGMMIAPAQDRKNEEKTVTNVVVCGGKLPVLIMFPGIFKGTHVNDKKCHFAVGKTITVKFDRATALQIDGETVTGVTEYTVKA